jgi:hypothetical protein
MNPVNHTLNLLNMLLDGPVQYRIMDPVIDPASFLEDLGLVTLGHGYLCITPLGTALTDRLSK